MDILEACLNRKENLELVDQYGFLVKYDIITHSATMQFSSKYADVLNTRLQKWKEMLERNGQLPARSDKLKRYVRKGIPNQFRAQCWFKYSGAEKLMFDNPGLYTLLTYREEQDLQLGYNQSNNKIFEFITVLERDLLRTFPDNIYFKPHLSELVDLVSNNGNNLSPTNDFDTESIEKIIHDTSVEDVIHDSIVEKLLHEHNIHETCASSSSKLPTNNLTPLDETIYQSDRIDMTSQSPLVKSLRRILVAFAYYSWPHPDLSRITPKKCSYNIGYCQSLNFIVGLILIIFTVPHSEESDFIPFEKKDDNARLVVEEKVFWILVSICERLLPSEMYGANLDGAQIQQELLWKWILGRKGSKFGVERIAKWVSWMESPDDPKIRRSLSRSDRKSIDSRQQHQSPIPPLNMITTQWFMTIFIGVLPIETVLRIWDGFFYQGEKILFRVVLTLLKIHEDQILSYKEPIAAWRYFKELPKQIIDCHRFMEIVFLQRYPFARVENPSADSVHFSSDDEDGEGEVHPKQNIIKRGVGSISTKLLEKYRDIVVELRRKESLNAQKDLKN